jgi:hypothetical protein
MKKILSQIIITCFVLTNLKAQTTDIRDNFVGVYSYYGNITWFIPPPSNTTYSSGYFIITKSTTDSTAIIFTDSIYTFSETLFCTSDSVAEFHTTAEHNYVLTYHADSVFGEFNYFSAGGLMVRHRYYGGKVTTALPETINNDFYMTSINSEKLVITVRNPNSAFYTEIYDILGRMVMKGQYTGEVLSIDISNLLSSVYILNLKSQNSSFKYKFYKN